MEQRFFVTVVRFGGICVNAASEDEARNFVDSCVKTDEVSWDDDWAVADVQPEEQPF